MSNTIYEQALQDIITEAIARVHADMRDTVPFMATVVEMWGRQLSGTHNPADYFTHPLAFPMFLLPWWLETTFCVKHDLSLHANLAYSTVNGYYYIRLIDNVMDGDTEMPITLLPVLNFFHTQFQLIYCSYFPANHSFWSDFKMIWWRSGEAAMEEAAQTTMRQEHFLQSAAQKICAAKIPVAAVCYSYKGAERITAWWKYIDILGCWHQMMNDLFDWNKDLARHNNTYFLSESQRRKHASESVLEWVIREGFAWGCQEVNQWTTVLKRQAQALGSQEMLEYLTTREAMFLRRQEDVKQGFHSMTHLLTALSKL